MRVAPRRKAPEGGAPLQLCRCPAFTSANARVILLTCGVRGARPGSDRDTP
ncbi:hypothetical protein Slala04_26540 [Streptomyces lavendulae subsp. lavendulae]|nr:hypothetical protein Slala04_26540 [Streptomyces lavendulae subsp. lavendulae]